MGVIKVDHIEPFFRIETISLKKVVVDLVHKKPSVNFSY